jgi:hypothetical protein
MEKEHAAHEKWDPFMSDKAKSHECPGTNGIVNKGRQTMFGRLCSGAWPPFLSRCIL